MRALPSLHLLRRSAPSPNAKQSFHPGQHPKPVTNATTWPQQQQASQKEEEEGGLHQQVHLQATAENDGAGDRNMKWMCIFRWSETSPMDSNIKFHSRIAAIWKIFKKKGWGSSGLQKTVSAVNIDSIQAGKHHRQCGRAQLQTRSFIECMHKEIRCNQTKLQLLLPQRSDHVNTIPRREASLQVLNWS